MWTKFLKSDSHSQSDLSHGSCEKAASRSNKFQKNLIQTLIRCKLLWNASYASSATCCCAISRALVKARSLLCEENVGSYVFGTQLDEKCLLLPLFLKFIFAVCRLCTLLKILTREVSTRTRSKSHRGHGAFQRLSRAKYSIEAMLEKLWKVHPWEPQPIRCTAIESCSISPKSWTKPLSRRFWLGQALNALVRPLRAPGNLSQTFRPNRPRRVGGVRWNKQEFSQRICQRENPLNYPVRKGHGENRENTEIRLILRSQKIDLLVDIRKTCIS